MEKVDAVMVVGLVRRSSHQEFALLPTDANIYKLVGPVLLKQDGPEAVSTVKRRLEFIQGEM